MSRVKVIYVVDPDLVTRRHAGRLLAQPGRSFRYFADAEHAWAELDVLRPDLVVSDTTLPRVSGVGFLEAIHRRDPMIATILVARGEMPAEARRALRGGTIGGLATKPLDSTFVQMARGLLGETTGEPGDDWFAVAG